MKKLFLILGLLVLLLLVSCSDKDNNVIRIAHKNYTEQRIHGEMLAVLIEENTDYKTSLTELGGTLMLDQALKSNNVDLCLEYSGIGYFYLLNQDSLREPEEIYEYLKEESLKEGITWLKPLGYNNTYSFGVTKETAEKYNLEKFSDLVGIAENLSAGEFGDFFERPDGMPGVTEAYGFSFGREANIDVGLKYRALVQGEIDVVVVYTTDSLIEKYNIVVLEDDKNVFPHYDAIPRMKTEFAENHPEIVRELKKLAYKFSDDDFRRYNYLVDVEGYDIKDVARKALREKGIIS